uniref:tRNA wybutosine-synthesizing protein 3 homolog n=1 Tax=Romanomermis culicivorax TaxID=13658 RepID=A0A915KE91_ROMCU
MYYDSDFITFAKHKAIFLSKIDMSQKGSVDEPIENLVLYLNNNCDDYFTTSSCSGRITLFTDSIDEQNTDEIKHHKKTCRFVLTSHQIIDFHTLLNAFSKFYDDETNRRKVLSFKFEPFIFQVRCRTLASAQMLHNLALECGFRNTGLTIGGQNKKKLTLTLRSTLIMEAPLNFSSTAESMQLLVETANEKMTKNLEMIRNFDFKFKSTFKIV